MEFNATATATAPVTPCWTALTDVADWPNWTASITSVTPLDTPEVAVGNRFRVVQPGLPALVWTVTEVAEGESFVWETRAPGARTVGWHRLTPVPDGVRIDVGVTQTGALGTLVAALMRGRTRRYLTLEAAGLKAAGESR
ncbi:hypothetical protein Afil01_64430 [Actinorhabdospora filicis]|uniref:Polyketide cyclase n=1 Tax=Actinorhabdospora filicis TaxID=1785913 RepID=A0A9W6WDI3_9ACTN|nr:SRPBCC family protein [Actinorhabdospora filicis]GLZ81636.1 hypothetical protein Afil01_64430 [Actinorhabdospora filicis]